MRLKARFDIALITGLVIVALVCAISWIGASMLRENVSSEEQTWELLRRLDHVHEDVVDLETGMRGFVLTGDDRFLAPYERAKRELPPHVDQLRASVARDAGQAARVEELAAVITQRLASIDETVAVRRSGGFEAVHEHARNDAGKLLMDLARARSCGEIEATAQQRARREQRAAARSLARSALAPDRRLDDRARRARARDAVDVPPPRAHAARADRGVRAARR